MKNFWLMRCKHIYIDFDDSLGECLKEKYEYLYVSLVNIEAKHGKVTKIEMGHDIAHLLACCSSAPFPSLTSGLQMKIKVWPRWKDITWYTPDLRENMVRLIHKHYWRTYIATANLWKGYE